ncbi:FMN-binding negative transcriptional regulator [Streptomyces sp. TRM S81-3]|uniref:FMN-binding negative transcriptional regulator n=1 Tax=Streptomyces griseicoloratus TaxID=2752516 RepID=A0A926L6L8_9ACTN|nr:FMN-binding negative transcriptional regulator [Streptomyces griseicoloratus]MBD0422536.1 FMN-binding negative transcriptional regulator [Streptomyces griseicoloratus]
MLIHPWDAPHDDAEWQHWLAEHDFGQLAVSGPPGEPPHVQPLHFAYDAGRAEVVTHLARPNPLWHALEANPDVLLSVVDDYVYVPGPWQAAPDGPPEHGVPTSFYAAVQLRCRAHVVDDPDEKADLLNRQVGHFQPEGGSARAAAGEAPYGRMLSGIRGLRLEVTGVRAKFKYAGHRTEEVQDRIAAGLAHRSGPGDAAAREHLLRRRGT